MNRKDFLHNGLNGLRFNGNLILIKANRFLKFAWQILRFQFVSTFYNILVRISQFSK